MPPGLERPSNHARAKPRQVPEQRRNLLEHPPVVSCCRDHQEEPLHRVVASLEIVPAPHRLDVSQPHLQLDGRPLAVPKEHGVPGATLPPTFDYGKANLGSMRQRRPDEREEPAKSLAVPGVSKAMAAGIHPEREIEAEHGGDTVEILEPNAAEAA